MAFSRQHYVAIAKVLKEARKMSLGEESTIDFIADELAVMFAKDNARFDMVRFREATEA